MIDQNQDGEQLVKVWLRAIGYTFAVVVVIVSICLFISILAMLIRSPFFWAVIIVSIIYAAIKENQE